MPQTWRLESSTSGTGSLIRRASDCASHNYDASVYCFGKGERVYYNKKNKCLHGFARGVKGFQFIVLAAVGATAQCVSIKFAEPTIGIDKS